LQLAPAFPGQQTAVQRDPRLPIHGSCSQA
jgi:hypothetical protein